jgi:hypothetical protein
MSVEKNYWPTELETAGLVWVIKKVRHLIQSSEKTVGATIWSGATVKSWISQ